MRKPPTSYQIMNTKANHDTNGVNNGLLYVLRFFEGGIGQNVYSMGTIHRRKCTHCRLEITSTMPRCFLVTSTMSRHIGKNETRNKNRSFHMKRKKKSFIKTRKKNAHLIWAKKVSYQALGASHLQTRGVRKGCPLSPILFVLYVNVLLFAVPHHLSTPITQHESSHAFVNDLQYRSESSQRIEEILSFYDSKGRAWGLDINLSRTELHSMGKAPQTTITAPSGKRLSTIDPKALAPRKVYKCLRCCALK